MNNSILNFSTWLLSSLFYAYQMVLRVLPLLMADYLSRKVGMKAADIGLLASIYYIGYALAHIPVGIALDKFRPKYTIMLSIGLCIYGIYLMTAAKVPFDVYLSRFIIGAGSVAGFLGAAKVTGEFYPKRFGLMLGLSISIGFLGAIYGASPIADLLINSSPRQAMQALVLVAIILAASIWAAYNATPKNQAKESYNIKDALCKVLSNKDLWILGLVGGLLLGPLETFAGIWGIKFLTQIYNLREFQANYCINLILIGAAIGFPTFGFLTNFIKPRKIAILLGISNVIIFTILFSDIRLSIQTIFYLCFFIGMLTTHEICVFVTLTRNSNENIVSLARALVNMIIMSFGFIYTFSIGYILHTFFESSSYTDLIYDSVAYRCAFGVMIIGMIIGVIGFTRAKIFD